MLVKRVSKIKRSFFKKITFFTLLQWGSFLLILGLIFLYFKSSFFTVGFIDCYKDDYPCSPADLTLLEDIVGKKILAINKSKLLNTVLYKDITLENVEIITKIPNKIIVKLKKRQPVAVYSAKNGNFLLDKNGFIYAEPTAANFSLPLVVASTDQGAILGTQSESKAVQAVNLAGILNEFFIPFGKIEIANGDLLVYSYDNLVYFSTSKDLTTQASSLQLILRSSKIVTGNKKNTKIDLRFDKPVINNN